MATVVGLEEEEQEQAEQKNGPHAADIRRNEMTRYGWPFLLLLPLATLSVSRSESIIPGEWLRSSSN